MHAVHRGNAPGAYAEMRLPGAMVLKEHELTAKGVEVAQAAGISVVGTIRDPVETVVRLVSTFGWTTDAAIAGVGNAMSTLELFGQQITLVRYATVTTERPRVTQGLLGAVGLKYGWWTARSMGERYSHADDTARCPQPSSAEHGPFELIMASGVSRRRRWGPFRSRRRGLPGRCFRWPYPRWRERSSRAWCGFRTPMSCRQPRPEARCGTGPSMGPEEANALRGSSPVRFEGPCVHSASVMPSVPDASETARPWQVQLLDWRFVLAAAVLPPLLYLILRPENFGLTPNSLDPVFYTGYSINFDDILNAVGDDHYFISRWTSYYPVYVMTRLTDPFIGRLLVRWIIASGALAALWHIRPTWSWSQRLVIGVLVLTSPMFVRPFMTDYVEFTVVGVGLCVAAMCVSSRPLDRRSMFVVGLLSGVVIVANPLSITVVGLPLLAAFILGWRGVRSSVEDASVVLLGALIAPIGGLLLFRWRYGVPNVYQPTLDFITRYQPPAGIDPWRSPPSAWVGHFTWLWVAPLLVCGVVIAVRRGLRFERNEIAAIAICGAQWLFQCFDEIVRKGYGLQVPFYWSYSFPAYAIGFAVVVGKLTEGLRARWMAAVGGGWLVLMAFGVPASLHLPANAWFALVGFGVLAGFALALRSLPVVSLSLLVVFAAFAQVAAPHYRPASADYIDTSPLYDQIFLQAGNVSEDVHDEIIWFSQQMDRIPNDASTSFLVLDSWSSVVSALYGAHVSGRLLAVAPDGIGLSEQAAAEVRSGKRPIVAVYGPPSLVASTLAVLPDQLGVGRVVLDETNSHGGLGYRLVVFEMPDATRLPFTWNGAALYRQRGVLVGTDVVVGSDNPPGIITFGPYILLRPGPYTVTVTYRADAPPASEAGLFDVSSMGKGVVADELLPGTNGAPASVPISFDVTDSDVAEKWEFRTFTTSDRTFVVESITLEAL